VAITFATLGVGLIALGGLVRVLEGAFELGPQGFKGQIAARGEAVIAATRAVNPSAEEPIRGVVRYLEGADLDKSARMLKYEDWLREIPRVAAEVEWRKRTRDTSPVALQGSAELDSFLDLIKDPAR
jgi:hypothetical protein